MIIGKGSLFLGRMTNLFDGVSIVVEKRSRIKMGKKVYQKRFRKLASESERFRCSSTSGLEW